MRIISGRFKGHRLKTGEGPGYRPAMSKVREALFSMLEARGVVWSDAVILDLFAGSGALGFEALSRGASRVFFVESSLKAARLIRANLEKLLGSLNKESSGSIKNGISETDLGKSSLRPFSSQVQVICKDVRSFLHRPAPTSFNVIFIDPPYGQKLVGPTLTGLVKGGFCESGAILAAEIEADRRAASISWESMPELSILASKDFGQTRIFLWKITRAV